MCAMASLALGAAQLICRQAGDACLLRELCDGYF